MEKTSRLYLVDGEGGGNMPPCLENVRRMDFAELDFAGEAPSGIALLNMDGRTLRRAVGVFFRLKLPFALFSVAGMDAADLAHLAATAKKRKNHCWLLGGCRMLPIVAAAKEIIAGGCLGAIETIRVAKGGDAFFAQDAARWLGAGAPGSAPAVSGDAADGGNALSVECRGTAGSLAGCYDFANGRGWLDACVNGHARRREFGAADTLELELELLDAMGLEKRDVPGVIPLKDVGDAEKLSK